MRPLMARRVIELIPMGNREIGRRCVSLYAPRDVNGVTFSILYKVRASHPSCRSSRSTHRRNGGAHPCSMLPAAGASSLGRLAPARAPRAVASAQPRSALEGALAPRRWCPACNLAGALGAPGPFRQGHRRKAGRGASRRPCRGQLRIVHPTRDQWDSRLKKPWKFMGRFPVPLSCKLLSLLSCRAPLRSAT